MLSQSNSLLVFVSDFSGPSLQLTTELLEEGGVGWYDEKGDLGVEGEDGFLTTKRKGKIYRSARDAVTSWDIKSYAPALPQITVLGPITAPVGEKAYYEISASFNIPGMTGKYVKKGVTTAGSADAAADIAAALVASFNAGMQREGDPLASAAVTGTAEITVTSVMQAHTTGKKYGSYPSFSLGGYSPDADYIAETTQAAYIGIGTGNFVNEKENFAWGNQDSFRENDSRVGFKPVLYSTLDGMYDMQAHEITNFSGVSNPQSRSRQNVYTAFNTEGDAPPAVP